jgi:DNA-binding transcriptional MocR family regulator
MWIASGAMSTLRAMTMWLPNLEGRGGPVYRAIADAIDEGVQAGTLRGGARLPPHRDLADHLGVTVTTITRAYTEAARRGLTNGHVGRGTFIRGNEPEDLGNDTGLLDLSINVLMPDQEVARLEARLFQRRVLPWTQILGYVPSRGHLRHRQAMAAWLAKGGLVVDPDRVVLTGGAQHAIAVSFSALLKPGDTVLMEELTYSGARVLAEQMHLKTRGVALDAEGLKPEALEQACRSSRARVLYCMPRLHNPTSAVMSERRRRQIAAIVERYKLTVIEDDVYGFLSPERTPLAALIPERTVFITSLSKSLFPGMRLGCVVAPPVILEKVVQAVWATMLMASPIGADLLSGWIEDGTAARISQWKQHEVVARQQMARRLLRDERIQTHPNSAHLWLLLPPRWTVEAFVAQARARGVILNGAGSFAVTDNYPRAVRLCIGTPRTRAGLEQALARVVAALADRVPVARAVV